MDAYQQQQRFPRPPLPPPPPAPDPYLQQQQQQHFQYPQQQQQQWGPHPPQQYSYPPPPPPQHLPPSHYPPPSIHPYSLPNQPWPPPHNWGHHPQQQPHQPQPWDYQAQSHEEDWGAKARAWADANKATESQNQQFIPPGRPDEQSHYHEQYPNPNVSQYTDPQHQQPLPPPSYQQQQQLPGPPPINHPPFSFDASSYAPEGHHLHGIRDPTSAPDSSALIHHRQGSFPSPSVHQQEVPSSYSSATGHNGGTPPMSNSVPMEGQHHMQPPPVMPLADRPLEFTPRFTHENPQTQTSYSYLDPAGPTREMDNIAPVPSMNSWTGPTHYPPMPPVMPPGPQHDPALVGPPFSSFPGSGFNPVVPSGGPPFGLGGVNALQQNSTFPVDAYGISNLSERPKKASVPNWLKEEIKKAVITAPSLDHPKEESHSIEDDVVIRSFGRGDPEDSKSIDSPRSAEEDEEDEDYEDAARAAAINQEIKRVLTDVLLKVTDELFDEIATKVLDEEIPTGKVDKSVVIPNHKSSLSASVIPTPKEDAKLLTPGKSRESETEVIAEKSGSLLPGDLLGLADYATDDDDEEVDNVHKQSSSGDKQYVNANGSSLVQPAGISSNKSYAEPSIGSSLESGHRLTPEDAKSVSKDIAGVSRSDLPEEIGLERKTTKDNNKFRETKFDKNDQHESKKTSGREYRKEEEKSEETRTNEKNNGSHKRYEERHSKREKTDEPNKSKEKGNDRNTISLEKVHESGSKKRPLADDKEDRKDRERNHKESSRKREHTKDKNDDRSRHKRSGESSKNKKRRSSSVSRGRSGKDNSNHRDNDSSDDDSSDSRRKPHSRRRSLSYSPSPVKSRRRGRRSRSRSRSPVRRHR